MSKMMITPSKKPEVSRYPLGGMLPRTMLEDWIEQFLPGGSGNLTNGMSASMDVAESDQAFEVTMDLPGVDSDNVEIQIDDNTLTVRGQRQEETEEEDKQRHYHQIERYSGSFSRSVMLPGSIDENAAAAEFKDGVLKIFIPKSESAKPRRIKIKS